MLLKKHDSLKITKSSYSRELHIIGCEYSAHCEKCQKLKVYRDEDILVDVELGGKHWLNITFYCEPCDYEWEEELQIEVTIDVHSR